jgi:thymidylate synthase
MNKLDTDYKNLLKDILENGIEKKDRTGTGTISVFGRQIRHKMSDGFPLLTTKKLHWNSIVTELLWFLNGRTDLRWLLDRGNTIWAGDAYKQYSTYVTEEWDMGGINELFEDGLLIEVEESFDYECESRQINYRKLTKEEFIDKIKTDDGFSKKWGELGPIYGTQWRKWRNYNYIIEGGEIFNDLKKGFNTDKEDIERDILYEDQVTKLIHNLKNNPDDRGLIVSAWNVGDLDNMVLRPCHNFFQVYTRELTPKERYDIWFVNNYETGMERYFNPDKLPDFDNPYYEPTPTRAISLMWNQRSCDVPLGIPFNIASYGLLLKIIGKIVNMVPDELIGNLGDTHIYLNQIEGIKEQLTREPYLLPTLRINTEFWPTKTHECGVGEFTDNIDLLIKEMRIEDFQIENYQSHPTIKMPLSN